MKINKTNTVSFKSHQSLHPVDLAYKKLIQQGLKDTFNLSCKIEDLKSVAGPVELNMLLNKFQPKNYVVGNDYRVNYHIHSKASDGGMSSKEFLERAIDYANFVFKKGKKSDDLPSFSAALTDHNSYEGTKEVLSEIVQNPEKVKNFKFASGCEFMMDGYKKPYSGFEAIGLGFNPFDRVLNDKVQRYNDVSFITDIKKAHGTLFWAHPLHQMDKINPEFFRFLKKVGVEGVEGHYQYNRFHWENIDKMIEKVHVLAKKFNMLESGGQDNHRHTIFLDHPNKPNI